MKLTPLDIRHKDFKRGMRGYVDVEVDEFLDEVADEYERLFKENIDLNERVEALEDKVNGYQRIEETLQKTLVNAQANAEEQKQNANKQAQLVLQDAELKARQLVNEAYIERQAVEQSMSKLRVSEEDFRFKFRQLLDGYLRQLQDTPKTEDVPATPPVDLSLQAEAIKQAIARESAVEPAKPAKPDVTVAAEPPAAAAPKDPEAAAPPPPPAAPEAKTTAEEPREAPVAAEPAQPQTAPQTPAAAARPARGPSGVQAGVPRGEAALAAANAAAGQAAPPPKPAAAAEAETTAAEPRPAPEPAKKEPAAGETPTADKPAPENGRAVFGESDDDLLADVDTEVNENEFKW